MPLISKTGKNVVKTIYLPNDQLNQVALENEELRKNLEERRLGWAQEVEQLREEFRDRESELFLDYNKYQEEINSVINANKTLEKDNIHLVKGKVSTIKFFKFHRLP